MSAPRTNAGLRPGSLTVGEHAILSLWDQGHSIQQITRQGHTAERVRWTISTYHDRGEERDAAAGIRAGSRKLLAAIRGARA